MTVFENVRKFFYVKSRPRRYKAKDAAYEVGGKRGIVLAALPSDYPMTPQQRRVAEIARECGIKPGISKAELQKAMKECVGPKMRKTRKA